MKFCVCLSGLPSLIETVSTSASIPYVVYFFFFLLLSRCSGYYYLNHVIPNHDTIMFTFYIILLQCVPGRDFSLFLAF